MATRLLLGIVAALRAVLIPGQAQLLCHQPLSWQAPNLRWLTVARVLHAPRDDRRSGAGEAPAA